MGDIPYGSCGHTFQKLWPSSASGLVSTSPKWVELTDATIIAWIFACWACAVKVNLTDTTNIIVGDVPTPSRNTVPSLYFDLHDVSFLMTMHCCRKKST